MLLPVLVLIAASLSAGPLAWGQTHTCDGIRDLATVPAPEEFPRSMTAVRTRLSRSDDRDEAIMGGAWVSNVRESTETALERMNLELGPVYASTFSAFCHHPSVLTAMERPDALGYGGGSALTCERLIADLDNLDPNDPLPGTRARSVLFRMSEYQSLRVAIHRAAFVAHRLRLTRFENLLQRCTPPTPRNIDDQLSALRTFSVFITNLCRGAESSFQSACDTARGATDRFITQVQDAIQESCNDNSGEGMMPRGVDAVE